MVKLLFVLFLLFTFSFAEDGYFVDDFNSSLPVPVDDINSTLSVDEIGVEKAEIDLNIEKLDQKIRSLLDEEVYNKNLAYIKIIFSPSSDFIADKGVDAVKVVETLKENGLLSLYFDKPQELILNFKTSDNPLFFMKMMGDTLRNIGYYRYVTRKSKLDEDGFTWSIALRAEYAVDPHVLQEELKKSGSSIIDITMISPTQWTFNVDIRDGFLNVPKLHSFENLELKRSLYAYWLDVSEIKDLDIQSSRRNSWYPYITYFDSSLHLLKVIKKDVKTNHIFLSIPNGAKYIKISDIYTLKNIKNFLLVSPKGAR